MAASPMAPGSVGRIRACSSEARRDGTTQTHEYTIALDVAGRIAELRRTIVYPSPDTESLPGANELTIRRSYDAAGRLVEEIRRDTTELANEGRTNVNEKRVTWSRDAAGRIDRVEQIWSLFTNSALTNRELDLVTVVKRHASGRPSRVDRTTTMQFRDDRGRPSAEDRVRREEPFREREYDSDGRVSLEHWTDDGGVGGSKRSLARTFVYEKKRVTIDFVVKEGTPQTGQRTVTTYDERGLRLRRERFELTASGAARKPTHFEQRDYDDAGRIAAMTNELGRSTFQYRGDCPTNLTDLFELRFNDSEPFLWDELEPSASTPY
jgi:hypothetical protein